MNFMKKFLIKKETKRRIKALKRVKVLLLSVLNFSIRSKSVSLSYSLR